MAANMATAIRYVLKHTSLFGFGKDAEPAIRLIHVTPNYASYVAGDISGMAMPVYSAEETEAMRAAECKAALDPARELLRKAGVEFEEVTFAAMRATRLPPMPIAGNSTCS